MLLEHPTTPTQFFSTAQAINPELCVAVVCSVALKLLAFLKTALSSSHVQIVTQIACGSQSRELEFPHSACHIIRLPFSSLPI